jgi:hypothetical protein
MNRKERAGSARDARIHLKKANSYHAIAARALADGIFDPAVSNAVISGINAADVICLVELGRRNDNNDHEAAVRLLAQSGPFGRQAAPILARMLPRKNLSQYRTAIADERDAERTIEDAEQLLEFATQAAGNLP